MASDALRRQMDELKTDLETLQEDFSKLLGTVGEVARGAPDEARERLRAGTSRIYEQVRSRVEAAGRRARTETDRVGQQVEGHPFLTMAAAFAAGFLAARLLARD